MKKISIFLTAALFAVAMVSCEVEGTSGNNDSTGNGTGNGGGSTSISDTTLMNFTLLRSLVDIDWDEAADQIVALGFSYFPVDEEEEENVRAYIKGNPISDNYVCYLRCDDTTTNLVCAAVMQEVHGSTTQSYCLEANIGYVENSRSVLADLGTYVSGGNVTYGDMTAENTSTEVFTDFDTYASFLRNLDEYVSVTAVWADNYDHYTASCNSVTMNTEYYKLNQNIISFTNRVTTEK